MRKTAQSKNATFSDWGLYALTHIPKVEAGSGRYRDEPAHSIDSYLGFQIRMIERSSMTSIRRLRRDFLMDTVTTNVLRMANVSLETGRR